MKGSEWRGKAEIEFELSWESSLAVHRERFLAPSANLWRDIMDVRIRDALGGVKEGAEASLDFGPGEAVPPYDSGSVLTVRESKVALPAELCGDRLRLGRFYPRGLLSSAAGGPFPQDVRPFRVIALEQGIVSADCNHPLATRPLRLTVKINGHREKGSEVGGRCVDLLEEATGGGPGMEGRWKNTPTDFEAPGAFIRVDESEDGIFYARPRLTGHVDSTADAFLAEAYSARLRPGMRVLDLMSSVESHLPPETGLEVIGLGMNGEEMADNTRLAGRVVRDLNAEPALPFPDGHFGAVVCSLSWEYLVSPRRIVSEAARVLAPGGALMVGLSNRWFPAKVTRLWLRLHEFERIGLVLEHLCGDGSFESLETLSVRNWPRPSTDRYWPGVRVSDPVFVVTALKR